MDLKSMEVVKFEAYDDLLKKIGVKEFQRNYNKGEGVKVMVIDSGADENHPELQGKINYKYNGLLNNRDITDNTGHGTHVSSLICGKNIGIAPNVELGVATALSLEGGSHLSVMNGLSLAIQLEYDIVCLSLGSLQEPPMILLNKINVLASKGITVCCATGNNGAHEPLYPAKLRTTIAVGGLDNTLKEVAPYSNRGYDILAPSYDVFGAYPANLYVKMTGTSMANPIVVGVIALIKSFCKSNNIHLTEKKLKELLVEEKYIHKDTLNNIIKKIKEGI